MNAPGRIPQRPEPWPAPPVAAVPNASFVLGFLFDSAGQRITLITKRRPSWQAGGLNGLGGRVNLGELTFDAMNREFREEAGVFVGYWERYAYLSGRDFEVVVFKAFSDVAIAGVRTMTDEIVEVMPISEINVGHRKVISAISWLIPLALDRGTVPGALGPRITTAHYDAVQMTDPKEKTV